MILKTIQKLFGGKGGSAKGKAQKKPLNLYRAVRIRTGKGGGCEAARKVEGQTFLMFKAPALPLTGCTFEKCTCHFQRLKDRRQDVRRDSDLGVFSQDYMAEDKRSRSPGRRKTDFES